MITQEQLKEKVHYEPDTGVFTRLVSGKGSNSFVGAIAGTKDAKGYLCFRVFGKIYKSHRLAFLYMTGEFPHDQVDHVNMVKNDNRFSNLRLANNKQNQWNTGVRKSNKTGFRNVIKLKRIRGFSIAIQEDTKSGSPIQHRVHGFETAEIASEFAVLMREEIYRRRICPSH